MIAEKIKLTKQHIAESFSKGEFDKVFSFLSENVVWTVFQQFRIEGKNDVIKKCEETAKHFEKIETLFTQTDMIPSENKIIITGTAEFSKKGEKLEFVNACDIYEFDESDLLQSIMSYCVVKK